MNVILFFTLAVSFFVTFFILPSWIRRAKKAGLEGKDINKYDKPSVAEGGGIPVIAGFIIGVLAYIAIKTFYIKSTDNLIEIFALISSVMIACFIGVIDDILGWKIGLGRRLRILLCFIAAIPLMVINAGNFEIGIPFVDGLNLGIIYPLVLIPLGIAGTTTTFNFLAGYNGLETGQGILIIGALSIVSYLTGHAWLSLIGLCMVSSLAAFWIFNTYPAKVFPGDALTYSVGALIAIFAILGNFERVAVFFYIPYIIEVALKSRGKLRKESFGKPNKDNSLELPYNKIYGLEHFSIWFLKKFKKKVYEKDVVYFIHFIQIIFIALGFLIFKNSLFA
jgi:UDP-N-acetylglucosamine--dolichyl-phosphate N-acetylglucosaminephosphotransferase